MIRRKNFRILSLFFIFFVVVLAGCSTDTGGTAEEEILEPVHPVEIAEIEKGELTNELKLSGNIMAGKVVPVLPMLTGEVKAVHVQNGDTVKRNDILIELDATDVELNISQARAGLEAAQANLKSAKSMREQSIKQAELQLQQAKDIYKMIADADNSQAIPLDDVPEELQGVFQSLLGSNMPTENDKKQAETAVKQAEMALQQAKGTDQIAAAEASVKQAKVGVEMAEQQKTHAVVRAPMAGQISNFNVAVGEMVSPQAPLLQLVQMDEPIVQITVNETVLPNIQVGETVDVHIRSFNQTYEGHIKHISILPAEQSRAYPVEITLTNPDDHLRMGMLAEVIIQPSISNEQILVPVNAVSHENDERFVYVTSDGERVEKRLITIGSETSEWFAAEDGLEEGEYVVVRGVHQLYHGALINIRNDIGQNFGSQIEELVEEDDSNEPEKDEETDAENENEINEVSEDEQAEA
ncbi:efflux RND transporter periplasmic adaptor subunit [Alkalihalobacterium alkalinitrilicum]|uniref:efflux RND transporter periplasmic adaptor subunit n=1 Tax=Alkalihalobacterium alkalinitrilicum TaxID=427920 RepID=UPI00130379B3|nr:efflux RND transporter periplasmic adaptor subunit [Alkalihalobacterium alkalinitrilicum]